MTNSISSIYYYKEQSCDLIAAFFMKAASLISWKEYCESRFDYYCHRFGATYRAYQSEYREGLLGFTVNMSPTEYVIGKRGEHKTNIEILTHTFGSKKVDPWLEIGNEQIHLEKNFVLLGIYGICFGMSVDFLHRVFLQVRMGKTVEQSILSICSRYRRGAPVEAFLAHKFLAAIRYKDCSCLPLLPRQALIFEKMGLTLKGSLYFRDDQFEMDQDVPDGFYLVRIDVQEMTLKDRSSGHAIAMIKESGRVYFLEPNSGIFCLDISLAKRFITDVKKWCFDQRGCNFVFLSVLT